MSTSSVSVSPAQIETMMGSLWILREVIVPEMYNCADLKLLASVFPPALSRPCQKQQERCGVLTVDVNGCWNETGQQKINICHRGENIMLDFVIQKHTVDHFNQTLSLGIIPWGIRPKLTYHLIGLFRIDGRVTSVVVGIRVAHDGIITIYPLNEPTFGSITSIEGSCYFMYPI